MARITGVDIPNEKRLDIALTYIYGIGRSNVNGIIRQAKIEASRRVKTLTDEEISRITKVIEKGVTVEGNLRQQVSGNIKRLREINTYRGIRHARNLPSRGQRTRSNARTRRGKRVTIGAMKKDDRVKLESSKTPVTK
ncbi:30S ribosomal protein S13 [Candidatus Gottesmanbacteria bacterium RBG_16_52_11]|uniref:Small ribosomal subunit protein uS13 n=1 Tax=Candidatus Gottesmanbacteria bacterium RBG_16_52_11 TaxID=1798374 RepID=A0A1F5YY60_9BACT|nr:MAG: 30S ribosomal protein S13 [Candidatus Gottesmanbacteria bacterium RBG_16_52_11]